MGVSLVKTSDGAPVARAVLRLRCSGCDDTAPDADVMGEGVSRGALCRYVDCGGTYRDVASPVIEV